MKQHEKKKISSENLMLEGPGSTHIHRRVRTHTHTHTHTHTPMYTHTHMHALSTGKSSLPQLPIRLTT